jgi:hypothetical protein
MIDLKSDNKSLRISDERSLLKAEDFDYMQLMSGGRGLPSIKNIVAVQVRYSFRLLHVPRTKASSFFKLAKVPYIDIDALPFPWQLHFLDIPLRPFFVASRRFKRCKAKLAALHV